MCHCIVPVRVIGGVVFVVNSIMTVVRCETCCGFVFSSSFYICLSVKVRRYGLRMDATFVKHGLFIYVWYSWEDNMNIDMGCLYRHIGKKVLNLCIYYHSLFMFIIHMPYPVVRYDVAAFRLTRL